MAQLRHRALLEMNHVIHSGSLRIFPRRLDYLAVNIVALNVYLYGIIHHLGRFINRVVPAFLRNQVCPALRQEGTVHARCHICRDHRRLDWESTASAERIDQNPVRFPRSQKNQRRCQCFRDRRLTRHLTVTALVQRLAARIDTDCHLIFIEKNAQRIFIARLRHPVQIVIFLHMTGNRLFHDFLDI